MNGASGMAATIAFVVSSCLPTLALAGPPAGRAVEIQTFAESGNPGNLSEAAACVPSGWKIIGGGASVKAGKVGGLLTASYPEGNCWVGRSKAHEIQEQQRVQVVAIAIRDEANVWDVVTDTATSGKESAPSMQVRLRPGYVMTGGGARANWTGAGSLLTASFPATTEVWEARAKDHGVADPATVTAYVIGIRARRGAQPISQIFTAQGALASHPERDVTVAQGFVATGGGARVNWTGAGNLLTESHPCCNTKTMWRAAAKDHKYPSPASLTVFAVGLKF